MAKKRHTIKFVRGQFKKERYILLTKNYVNNRQKLSYVCPEGHEGNICWCNWQQGDRCAKCAGNKRLTIKFIREQFKKEDYILLLKEYKNNTQKLKYICPKKHIGTICWHEWVVGKRCLECAGTKKLTIEFIRREFEKENYKLLTRKYINNYQKLDYICPKKHKGSISWRNWYKDKRCKQCFVENNRGKNNSNWNLNLTDKDKQDRRIIPRYIEWVKQIKIRNNFTC